LASTDSDLPTGITDTVTLSTTALGVTLTSPVTSTQASASLDADHYEALVAHFEKVSTEVLTIAKWVVLLVGGLGGASGIIGSYFSIATGERIRKLKNETSDLELQTSQLMKKIEIAERLIRSAFDLRDRNHEVRIRAVQQLGASNDISAVSILVDLIETDRSLKVRMESVYWLGMLLSDGAAEPEALAEGIEALEKATRDESERVRQEALEVIDDLVCAGVDMPRSVVQRIREIPEYDKFENVREAARAVLERIGRLREIRLEANPGPMQR
jgi:hypothetical protein